MKKIMILLSILMTGTMFSIEKMFSVSREQQCLKIAQIFMEFSKRITQEYEREQNKDYNAVINGEMDPEIFFEKYSKDITKEMVLEDWIERMQCYTFESVVQYMENEFESIRQHRENTQKSNKKR